MLVLYACASPTATPIALPTLVSTRSAQGETSAPPALISPTANNTRAPTPAAAPTTETVPPAATVGPTSAPAQPAPASSGVPQDFFGVNSNGEILYNDRARAMAILGGVQMVRTSVEWDGVETTPGVYNWGGVDSMFKTLLTNNLAPLVMVLNNPKWVATTQCGPVDDLVAFDKFLRTLVARYPDVRYWALYNEPDNEHPGGGCFGGQDLNNNGKPDVQDYAEQLRIAWRAIHQTNPNAVLITGAVAFDNFSEGTVPSGYPGGGKGGTFNYHFLEQLFGYVQANPLPGGDKYFDLVGFNFYGIYGPYWESQTGGIGVGAKVDMLKRLMNNAGISAPLLLSETGSNSKTVGDEEQSLFAVKTLTRSLANGVSHVVWWTFQDVEDAKPPPFNTWKFGLIDENQKPKPSYNAFQTLTHQLTGASFGGPLQVAGGEGYLFSQDKTDKAVVWSASDQPTTITFSGKALQVTDTYGTVHTVQDNSAEDKDSAEGRIALAVDKNPVYIQLLNP